MSHEMYKECRDLKEEAKKLLRDIKKFAETRMNGFKEYKRHYIEAVCAQLCSKVNGTLLHHTAETALAKENNADMKYFTRKVEKLEEPYRYFGRIKTLFDFSNFNKRYERDQAKAEYKFDSDCPGQGKFYFYTIKMVDEDSSRYYTDPEVSITKYTSGAKIDIGYNVRELDMMELSDFFKKMEKVASDLKKLKLKRETRTVSAACIPKMPFRMEQNRFPRYTLQGKTIVVLNRIYYPTIERGVSNGSIYR